MLSDLVVIDASSVLAGPSVGTFLAELGATVTKVEHPILGDVTRSWKLPDENRDTTVSAYFSSVNYRKNYTLLDLATDEGKQTFLNLISKADILLTNFKKGDDQKFGIEDELLHQLNERLIIGKISGYGPSSDRVAYDLILQAESGFMSMNGTPESGPVKMPVALIDVLAAHHLKEGILLALYERTRTGRGKTVQVSLYDAAVSSLVNQASNFLMMGKIPQRIGSLHPNIAPYGELFTTEEGDLVTFAIGSDRHFAKLCEVLNLVELSKDPRFLSNQDRVVHRYVLKELLQERIQNRSTGSLLETLAEKKVPAAKIQSLNEVFSSESAQRLIRSERINGIETKRVTSVIFQ